MKITDELLKEAVCNCKSIMEVLRYFGLKEAGGSHYHYSNRIKNLGLNTKHFLGKGHAIGKRSSRIRPKEEILVKRESGNRAKASQLRRALVESGVEYICGLCAQPPEWRGNPLTLDVDHINENWLDDRKENLRFLCPNCHSQFSRKLLPC